MEDDLVNGWKDSRLYERYKKAVVEAMDETLERVLGVPIKEVVCVCLRHLYKLNLETCQRNPEEFITALREILGKDAASMIEKMVVIAGIDAVKSPLDAVFGLRLGSS